jgi:hypothetical protein
MVRLPLRTAALTCLVLVLLLLYCYGVVQQINHVNVDYTTSDQNSILGYARKLSTEGWSYAGDRNRMPFYPWVQSLFYDPTLSEEASFLQAKYVSLILSLALLGVTFMFLNHELRSLQAAAITLITAFTVSCFKAAYLQPELLFYVYNLLGFILMARMLRYPTWQLAVLIGLVLALGHLTKASVLPELVWFLALLVARYGTRLVRCLRTHQPSKPSASPLLHGAIIVVVFLACIYPYISVSKRVFGHYFYNVNSTFYMWYDSWDEVKQGTRVHGDRKGWPDMPAEEIPTLAKYVREHSLDQMSQRLRSGLILTVRDVRQSYGYHRYLLAYLAAALLTALLRWRQALAWARGHPFLMLFGLGYFGFYLLLYAWFYPISGGGDRFVLALFLPLMWLAASVLRLAWDSDAPLFGRVKRRVVLTTFSVLVLAALVPDVYWILTQRILVMYGGN